MIGINAVFACLLAATTTPKADWNTTFEKGAVGSQVQGNDLRILVAGAGDNRAESNAAARALVQALRAGGRAKIAMDDGALGSIVGLDDEAIVKKTAKLPTVDQVFIVRVFPGSNGTAASAVITMYNKAGTTIGAFTGTAGVAMTTAAARGPGEGVSASTQSAVDSVTKVGRGKDSAKEDYDKRYVWFEDLAAVTNNGAVVAQWSQSYKGKYKEPLEGADFYDYVGRADLAATYRSNSHTKMALGIGSGAAYIVGTGVMLYGLLAGEQTYQDQNCDPASPTFTQCEDNNIAGMKRVSDENSSRRMRYLYIGVGIDLVGLALTIADMFVPLHPVTASEARELADKYNKKLQGELGLGPSASVAPSPDDEGSKLKLSWQPYGLPDGAGVNLRLDF